MRYCGVDISAKPANQQLVTLHERRAPEGGIELVATFYAPGTVEQVARTIEGFGHGGAVVAVVGLSQGADETSITEVLNRFALTWRLEKS